MDDQTKFDMIHHIVHDWAKLVEIHTTPVDKPAPLNHAVERAFLVECRKFWNFFTNKRGPMTDPLQKDAVSMDYVTAKRFKPSLKEWNKWHSHINVHLMHLSYNRVQNKVPWTGTANQPIFEEMLATWSEFLGCVDSKYAGEFQKQWAEARARFAF